MAARLNPRQEERTRSAIQTTQLVKRLQHFALGQVDEQGATVDLDASRIRAIEILLKKTLPDLTATQHGEDPERPFKSLTAIALVPLGHDDDAG